MKRQSIFSITKRQSILLLIISPNSTIPSDSNEFFIPTNETELINSPFTYFSLWCGILVDRVEK